MAVLLRNTEKVIIGNHKDIFESVQIPRPIYNIMSISQNLLVFWEMLIIQNYGILPGDYGHQAVQIFFGGRI